MPAPRVLRASTYRSVSRDTRRGRSQGMVAPSGRPEADQRQQTEATRGD